MSTDNGKGVKPIKQSTFNAIRALENAYQDGVMTEGELDKLKAEVESRFREHESFVCDVRDFFAKACEISFAEYWDMDNDEYFHRCYPKFHEMHISDIYKLKVA
jgi:hypothetical protein